MASEAKNNPWNGLRTYREGETIYGRSEEIEILTLLITQNRQTVIYGKSGIGKSSILNAGIFPKIRAINFLPVRIRLNHNSEVAYLDQIKNRILEEVEKSDGNIKIHKILDKSDSETLWEFLHRIEFTNDKGEPVSPLLVFDQFEEIFTLENDTRKINAFFRELADVINDVMPQSLIAANSSGAAISENKEANSDDILDLGLDSLDLQTYSYNQSQNFHFVFILREDFLSYLERHTTAIPDLKNNRYCLQPINELQAAEIIMSPSPGLVSEDVAKLIIEKVTGEKDVQLNGIPELQVDAAILSLYLNQIYDRMTQEGDTFITRRLVETYSDNVIEDFYKSATTSLSHEALDWLENTLVNEEGRRDNRDRSTVLKETGLTEDALNSLIFNTKLLHQFSYGGNLRIEFIHDILCPVVVKSRTERRQRQLIEEEAQKVMALQNQHNKKLRRRNRILAGIIGVLIIAGIGMLLINIFRPKTSTHTLLMTEDESINLTDYWKARVSVLADDDTIHADVLDKSNPMMVFETKGADANLLRYAVDFLIGDFGTGEIQNTYSGDTHEITIPISHTANRELIKGVVAATVGSRAPVYEAMVIVDDQLAKTNYKGEFELYVASPLKDSTIRILKKRYNPVETKLRDGVYRLSFKGVYDFPLMAKAMQQRLDSSEDKRILKGDIFADLNGKEVSGRAHMVVSFAGDSIFGYTYYDNLHARVNDKTESYFLINGKFNAQNGSFKMHMMDAVYNEIEYNGHITSDSKFYGETFDKDKRIGYFIFQ